MTHPTDTQVPEWEKDFDVHMFMNSVHILPDFSDFDLRISASAMKRYITSILKKERKADHAYLAEEVEKLRRTDETQMSDDHVYDEAIADVLTIITGKE